VHTGEVKHLGWVWWLMPVIPATPEAKIGRIKVYGQPEQKDSETPSQQTSQV
jgi:hypothetical protein